MVPGKGGAVQGKYIAEVMFDARKMVKWEMNRIVLYRVADNGWVVPIRKMYKKARFKKKMSRYHDWHGFHKIMR